MSVNMWCPHCSRYQDLKTVEGALGRVRHSEQCSGYIVWCPECFEGTCRNCNKPVDVRVLLKKDKRKSLKGLLIGVAFIIGVPLLMTTRVEGPLSEEVDSVGAASAAIAFFVGVWKLQEDGLDERWLKTLGAIIVVGVILAMTAHLYGDNTPILDSEF
jgi:hypothetical protein